MIHGNIVCAVLEIERKRLMREAGRRLIREHARKAAESTSAEWQGGETRRQWQAWLVRLGFKEAEPKAPEP